MSDQLTERLKSSPCCGNCEAWDAIENSASGVCTVNSFWEEKGVKEHLRGPVITLNLAVCSRWEQKHD